MRTGKRTAYRAVLGFLLAAGFPWGAFAQEPLQTEPVVVTATRLEEKVSEQASSVSVVTRDRIDLESAGLAGDALQGIPGVDVQRSGSPGNLENIKIRGGKAAQTLVMIDGFPVNSPTLGLFDISSLPASLFGRMEVVRGGQSALYGSNAMTGVVNFLPGRPAKGSRYGIGASGGSFSTLQWGGYAEGAGDPGSFHLGGAGLRSEGILRNDDTAIASFLGQGDVRVGERNRFHGLVLSTDADKGVPIDFGTPRDINHRLNRRGFLAGGRWETRFSPGFSVTASASEYDEFSHEKDPADPGEAFPYVFDDETRTRKTVLGLLARAGNGERSATFAGVEFTRDRATDDLLSNFGDTHVSGTSINRSAYLQEEWRPRKGTGVSAGIRVDRNPEAGTQTSPRLAAYHDFERIGVRVRASAGRGFRVPTISEKTDPFIGNPSLSPETAFSYEAGADLVLAGGAATVTGTWFFQSFRNLIQYDAGAGAPGGFGQLRNIGRAFSRGAEATVSWDIGGLASLEAGYTYSDTWDATNQRRVLGVPTQRGVVSLLLSPDKRFTARVDWRAEGDMLDAPPNGGGIRRPGFGCVDVFARYLLPGGKEGGRGIALTGKVQNLLDRKYEERKGYPSPGFNFLLGAEMSI